MKSIMRQGDNCWFYENKSPDDEDHPLHTWQNLEKHHIFGGANRKNSEKYGLYVKVCCFRCHREGPLSIHKNPNKGKDLMLKQAGQREFEKSHTRTEFIRIFGKSWL